MAAFGRERDYMNCVTITGKAVLVLVAAVLLGGCGGGVSAVKPSKMTVLQADSGAAQIRNTALSASLPGASDNKAEQAQRNRVALVSEDSPEARHRAELIARGDLPEDAADGPAGAQSVSQSNVDNCPAIYKSGQPASGRLNLGISECQAVIRKGRPLAVRRLSKPGQPRRILLSFTNPDGTASHFEFVENRLVATY